MKTSAQLKQTEVIGRSQPTRFSKVRFEGGLDQRTPAWDVPPGRLRETLNYEAVQEGGYADIVGYEAFDGQTAPSSGTYLIYDVNILGTIAVGDTITGLTSGATGEVLAVVEGAPDYLVITNVQSGPFSAVEDLQVGGDTQARSISAPVENAADTPALHASYTNLAADYYRTSIAAVTGSGSILGVISFGGVVYAFRNNAGGDAAALYKSSSSGWTAVALGRELSFTGGGTYEIQEGDTITGATGGATAVITRVMLESGSWQAGDAAGRLIFASQTGTYQAENLNVGASLDVATIAGNSTAITLLPGGRYEFHEFNFGAGYRIYGCDTVNRGFEFDGTVFCPIATGMTTDTPTHVRAHKNHLFLSFGTNVQYSGLGLPYQWEVIEGAGALNAGDTVTGLHTEQGEQGGSALTVTTLRRTYVIYGSSRADWDIVPYREEVGAIAYTGQDVGFTMFLDGRGLTDFKAVQEHGNFSHVTLSRHIQAYMDSQAALAVASTIVRRKGQYRLFFSDKKCLYVTIGEEGKVEAMMPCEYDHAVTCATSEELSDGSEQLFFGSTDGFVYQMEKGTSFNGNKIEAWFITHFNNSDLVQIMKRYYHAALEVKGDNTYAEFNFSYILGYGDEDVSQPVAQTSTVNYDAFWDRFTWDRFTWDGGGISPARQKTPGRAENIAIAITKNSDEYTPVTHTGAFIRFSRLRQKI